MKISTFRSGRNIQDNNQDNLKKKENIKNNTKYKYNIVI